jgi:hypothetical protein
MPFRPSRVRRGHRETFFAGNEFLVQVAVSGTSSGLVALVAVQGMQVREKTAYII